jgi:hypothetical protein
MPAFTNILTSSCVNTVLLKYLELKVVVEWLTLLLRTRKILVQISVLRLAILTEVFVVFLSPSRQIPG